MESKRLTDDPNAVSYGEGARSGFRDGDVLCFRGRGPFGYLIRQMTNSPYSHIGITYRFEGRVYCLEAVGAGVRLVLMSQLMKRYKGGIDYYAVDVEEAVRRQAVSWSFGQLGKLYDSAGIVRFAWTLLSGNASKARADDHWFCSELVAAAFENAGLRLVSRAADFTTPDDLARSALLEKRFTLKP